MSRFTLRALAIIGSATLATAVLGAPAGAADTTTTFELTGGSLAISAPGAADLGSGETGDATLQGSLGAVTVTDERGLLAATWTASASSSDFTTGSAGADETIAATNVTYTPGAVTASSPATGVFVPTPGVVNAPLPIYTGAAVGNNSATWNPTITIALPAQAVVGEYSGTITHSVS